MAGSSDSTPLPPTNAPPARPVERPSALRARPLPPLRAGSGLRREKATAGISSRWGSPVEETAHEAHLLLGDAVPGARVGLRRHFRPKALEHGLRLPYPGERDVRVAFVAAQEGSHAVEPA